MTPLEIIILNMILWGLAAFGIYRFIRGKSLTFQDDLELPANHPSVSQHLIEMDQKQKAFSDSLRETQTKYREESQIQLERYLVESKDPPNESESMLLYEHIKTVQTDEELETARKQPGGRSTEEVLKRLQAREPE